MVLRKENGAKNKTQAVPESRNEHVEPTTHKLTGPGRASQFLWPVFGPESVSLVTRSLR